MLEGQTIQGQYHLEEFLGAGGYGGVFRATEVIRDRVIRQVAVKLICIDDIDRQRQELITALSVDHPNLLRHFAAGKATVNQHPFFYLLMELAEGSLEQRLDRIRRHFNRDEARRLLTDLTAGLLYLHSSDPPRVHRDLTPGNIFWVGDRWKIGDFGLTRLLQVQQGQGRTSRPAMRPGYGPPEAYRGEYFTASDMWSLGIVTVRVLSGRLPFNFRTEDELHRCILDYILAIPTLASPFAEIVEGCLRREPNDRLTAAEVQAILAPGARSQPTPPRNPIILPRPQVSRRWFLTGLAASGVVGAVGWEFARPKSPQTSIIPVDNSPGRSVPVPSAEPSPTAAPSNYTETRPSGVSLEMIGIPAGNFRMGSTADDFDKIIAQDKNFQREWMESEFPQRLVTVPAFWIGKFPITQEQYQALMDKNPSSFSGLDRPVDSISWQDAQAFCQRLSSETGKDYRLPSEAEWEYACRAGSQTLFSFGDNFSDLGDYGWYGDNSNGKTQPVGQKQPNAFGLYDMHGNVWEWCEDDWHDNYNGAPTDGSAWIENGNRPQDGNRLLRGGSWFSIPRYCRSAHRDWWGAGYRSINNGFRVVVGSAARTP